MLLFKDRFFGWALCVGGAAALAMLLGLCISSAGAVVPGPGWSVQSIAAPTNFVPGNEEEEEQEYRIYITNTGSRATDGSPVTITDTLPQGVAYRSDELFDYARLGANPTLEGCGDPCSYSAVVPAGDILELNIEVIVPLSAPKGGITNTVTVTGGGAALASVTTKNAISNTPAQLAIDDFGFGVTGLDGSPDTQAGDHPYAVSTSLGFTSENIGGGLFSPPEGIKDVVTDLPLGLAGSVLAAPRCPFTDLEKVGHPGSEIHVQVYDCPADTRVGNVTVFTDLAGRVQSSVAETDFPSVLYNMVPEHGYPAEFAFGLGGAGDVRLFASVALTAAGYVLRVTSPDNASQLIGVSQKGGILDAIMLTLFGDPGAEDGGGSEVSAGNPRIPYYTNPTACSGTPLAATVYVDTWQHIGRVNANGEPDFSDPNWLEAKSMLPATTGCELLSFSPSLTAAVDTTAADVPTGLATHLAIPQAPDNDFSLATADLKSATVALPAGLALSPSAADGLQACSDAQFAEESTQPAGCPEASQIGTAVAHTPSLGEPLEGQVFLGSPNCSPCTLADAQNGNLVRLFLQLRAPNSGIVIKVPGTTSVDPVTGALTASFSESPQQPVGDLTLTLKGGPRAPLATPVSCGAFTTNSTLTPWSAPESGPPALSSSSFEISSNCSPGFSPSATGGMTNNQAGAFSPLEVTVSRTDQEQDLSGVRVTTPPGLLGVLKGVERCPEPQAGQGACGQGSLIGHVSALVGAGSHPFYAQGGQAFLTGPYKGAPFGLSIVVPAVAGPFNLGNIVVRAAVSVDPHTAQITVTSDPLPTMVDGIPLQVKTVNVAIDRSSFMFNPTNCEPLSVGGMLSSIQGASAVVSSRFQAANCAALPYKPVFAVSTQAKTSKHEGASLTVKGTFPAGNANTRSVAVVLPKQLPARLTTIQQACPEATFAANPASCPAGSDIGIATATTPILASAVSGPAYLVSHGGAAFPDVVAILQAEGVTVDLVGSVNIKKGITSSDFATVPDAPIGSFTLTLPEGPHSGLAAVLPASAKGSLCGTSLSMPFTITGQNGAVVKQNEKIAVIGCAAPKKKPKTKKKKK